MAIRTTVVRGLAYNVLIEEFHAQDAAGNLSGYVVSIYVETASTRHLIRRSRLPSAAENLRRSIERDGIRVFRRFARN